MVGQTRYALGLARLESKTPSLSTWASLNTYQHDRTDITLLTPDTRGTISLWNIPNDAASSISNSPVILTRLFAEPYGWSQRQPYPKLIP